MKKPNEKMSISTRTIENDLKTLFQSEDDAALNINELAPSVDLEKAMQIFDELRVRSDFSTPGSRETEWTHPSILAMNEPDPISAIIMRARRAVLEALENGWSGPPYNPFALAEIRKVKLLPTDKVLDAQTHSDSGRRFTIEYNPQRPAARMRFSVAHELGHTLFHDCAVATRHRATHQEMKEDDWQLESLCNIAAAEILMPFGTLREDLSIRPSIGLVLDLRRKYLVSSEAVVNRLIRLSPYPCFAFLARLQSLKCRYVVEYGIRSPGLTETVAIDRGHLLPKATKASECMAIGTRQQEDVRWISRGKQWFVEYLGISPNPRGSCPRVLGLAFPPLSSDFRIDEPLKFIPGDASEPFGAEPKLLLQVVNDRALVWGGGFAKQARKKWPHAQADFRRWAYDRRNLKLGNIHWVKIRGDLTLVSLVCQHGLGAATSGPRLRYGSLFTALSKVAELAVQERASVHMPRIGTGDAGGSWTVIEGIIRETLISKGLQVRIYDLYARGQQPRQPAFEFPREIPDEMI